MSWFGRKPKNDEPRKPFWVTKVRRDVVRLFCETAKASHPHEFGGLLRAHQGVLTEIVILPGTVSGDTSAIFQLHMLPIDFTVKGTVHSHPIPNATPSGADLDLFRRFGTTHIIVAQPYTERSWRAYNARGESIALDVVD
ncbi:MAG: Mov34/MPN/PAD-1 family protein [Euryarchaeota archaeon]|nr:Mov34/MPN/PAD-1 family protein [Euryarchaeota archaeon]